MLANFLNKSKPINFIGIVILFFLGYLSFVFEVYYTKNITLIEFVKYLFVFIIFIALFFTFNFIVIKNSLTLDNLFGFFFFSLFSFCLLPKIVDYAFLITLLVYQLAIRRIYSLRSLHKLTEKLFDSGFWLGVLFVLDSRTLLFIPLIYFAIYIHHKITIHTTLIPIAGWITPLIVYFSYTLWQENTAEFSALFEPEFSMDFQFYTSSKYLFLVYFLCITSFISIFAKSYKVMVVNNTFRKNWILILINTIIAALYIAFLDPKNGSEFMYIAFPTAVLLANGIEQITKTRNKNSIIFLLLCFAMSFYFIL
ncbi:MAG: DUF6427 family protein [Polaribacter sp.]|jgi:hypothetical protein